MRRTADDIEADVARLAGKVTPKQPEKTADAEGEKVSTEPFNVTARCVRRDMRARIDAMEQALDKVNASGPRKQKSKTCAHAMNKLGDDIDRLNSASPDDWWDVTKARVTEYVDRIEGSVNRLDDRG